MTDALRIWDRAMFLALLLLVIFIPYSSAMIQSSFGVILISWVAKRILILRSNPNSSVFKAFCFPSQGLAAPLIFLAVLILGTIAFSHAPALSLKKFFSRFLQQTFLMYVAIEIINSQKRLYWVMVMLLWTLCVVNADVIYQFFHGKSFIFSSHMIYERVTGPMRHPNDLGTLLVTVLPIVLVLIITRKIWMTCVFKEKFVKPLSILCGFIFLLSLISLGFTSSRGAWVGFAVSMTLGSLFLRKISFKLIVLVFLVLFFWIFGVYFANTRTDIFPKESIHQTSDFKEASFENFLNTSRRSQYWQTAMNVIQKYPLFGCGYNAYIQTLQQLKMEPIEYPHNSILHITAEVGILGLLGYLAFFIMLFIKGFEVLRKIVTQQHLYLLGVGIYCGLIAWLIHSLLDTPWESLQLSILWWLLIGVLMSLKGVFLNLKTSKEV